MTPARSSCTIQMGRGLWPTVERRRRAAILAQSEAILADPIYTAKALAGLIDAVRSGDAAGTVVFWHGGGTPGLFESLD